MSAHAHTTRPMTRTTSVRNAVCVLAFLTLAACSRAPSTGPANSAADSVPPPSPVAASSRAGSGSGAPVAATASPPATSGAPPFVDTVWHVASTSAQEPGTTYVFLGNGVLVVDAPHGTPMHGRWTYVDGRLTMIEEGVSYPTDIVAMDAGHLTLRSHNPGGSVDIVLVAAPTP